MQNLQSLSDTELQNLRIDIVAEIERRNKLREIPNEMQRMAADFVSLGGTKNDLVDAINRPDNMPPETTPPDAPSDETPADDGDLETPADDDTLGEQSTNGETNDGTTDSTTGA